MKRLYSLFVLMLVLSLRTISAQTIVITPKWTAQAQFAGYYAADRKGFFKEEGLEDVRIEHPSISESSFSFLQKGCSEVAVMNLSFALPARAEGSRIVNIMQTSQENSLMLVSRFPIKDIASLHGKSIAVWNHLSRELLDRMAEYYGLDVSWIFFNSGINVFLSGAVDICLMSSYNEYLQLEECGIKKDSIYTFRLADYGYNLPEEGLYVTEDFYNRHPDAVRKLVKACTRGWQWVNLHREEALGIVMDVVRENNIGTNRYHQRKMLDEILRLQLDKRVNERTYRLNREDFKKAESILLNEKEKSHIPYQGFIK